MAKDNLKPTGRKGVFFIEHPTRRNGVRKDRQLVLRYTIDGKTRKEVFGWETEGKTAVDAERKILELRANAKSGEGATSLAEERAQREAEEKTRQSKALKEQQRNTTLADYFNGDYLEAARTNKKPRTVGSEKALFEKWIDPVMGHKPIRQILPLDFQRMQKKILKGDEVKDPETGKVSFTAKSPRTAHYCVSIVTQIWNMAFDNGVVDIQPPRRKKLNLPMIDNERTRAFTPEQAEKFFAEMKQRSVQWHDISMLSLLAGLRASEIFRLEIKDLDKERGMIFLKTPKKQKSQRLVLGEAALSLLARLKENHPTGEGLFFTNSKGHQIAEVSDTVQRVIDHLGFNAGITDRRDRLTFHSWRHTYATWMLDSGVDIYTVNQLLRHSSLKMTERYVHPQEQKLRLAAGGIESSFKNNGSEDTG